MLRSYAIMALVMFTLSGTTHGITRTWDGGGGNLSWHTAENWNPNGVPQESDDVVIDVPGLITVSHTTGTSSIQSLTSSETVRIMNGSTLNVQAISTTYGLDLNGVLGGTGDVTITGVLNWISGGMQGTGRTITTAASSVLMNSASGYFLSREMEHNGSATWTNGTWAFSNGHFINNGIFVALWLPTTNLLQATGQTGQCSFENIGTFTKQGIGVIYFINSPPSVLDLNNTGMVDLQEGSMVLNSGVHSGTFKIANNALLQLGGFGPHLITDTSLIAGEGDLFAQIFSSSTLICDGTIDLGGSASIVGGFFHFNGPFAVGQVSSVGGNEINFNGSTQLGAGPHEFSNATINFNNLAGAAHIAGPLTIANSTLGGNGDVDVRDHLTFSNSNMSGSGSTIIDRHATALIVGVETKTIARTIDNYGELDLQGVIQLAGSTINNYGLLITAPLLQTSWSVRRVTGSPVVNNFGRFTKFGSGSFTFGYSLPAEAVPVNNFGTIAVHEWTLNLLGGGINSGRITIDASCFLSARGPFVSEANSVIDGAGDLTLGSGTHNFMGTIAVAGSVEINGAEPPTVIISHGSPNLKVIVHNGSLTLNASQQWRKLTLMTNTTLNGTGDLALSEFCSWSGKMSGTGRTIIQRNAILAIGNPTLEREIVNDGTANWFGGTVTFKAGKFINNGTFITNTLPCTFKGTTGTNVWKNTGLFSKAGVGDVTFQNSGAPLPFNNDGVVDLNQTLLQINSGGEGNGQINVDSGATLKFNTNYATGSILLEGTLIISNGADLSLMNTYTQTATGLLQMTLTSGGPAPITCGEDIILDGALAAVFSPAPPPQSTIPLLTSSNGVVTGKFNTYTLSPPGSIQYSDAAVTWTTFAAGDVNGDGLVNIDDLAAVINGWGICPALPAGCNADLNANGFVNVDDLLLIINHWS